MTKEEEPDSVTKPGPSARPLAIDLFCGRGGWTSGLQAAGFWVHGVDIRRFPEYPGDEFTQADIATVHGDRFAGARLIVASPPCQGFSLASRARRHGTRPAPIDFELLAHALRIIREAQPEYWAIENVAGAVPHFAPLLGGARVRNAPWFVWGDFPGFLVGREKMPKGPSGVAGRVFWRGGSKRERAILASMVPAALARDLAEACLP